jgi:O-methyltransferase
MKTAIRTFLWKILGTPPGIATPYWKRPLDALAPRHQVVDMAIVNIQVATRNEPGPAASRDDDTLLGDYLEFGVYQGDTFIHAFKRATTRIPTMRFFAFDSFEGLPKIEGIDAGGEFHQGQFACSQDDFTNRLRNTGVDLRRCVMVPGWFDKSLTDEVKQQHQLHVASIAYIDCDLYESCVPVLAFLTDLVRQGTILIFDDWFHFRADPTRGVQRATTEWLAANPHITLIPWLDMAHHGKCFFVNINR